MVEERTDDTAPVNEPIDAQLKMPPEYYLHLTFLVMATGVIFLSIFMTVVPPSMVFLPGFNIPLPESCSAKLMWGIDCPACGLTRAFISISDGNFSNAWRFNPASFLIYLFVFIQIPWQAFQMLRIRGGKQAMQRTWMYILPVVAMVCMFGQWIVRMFA
jgi:hypothetical protein